MRPRRWLLFPIVFALVSCHSSQIPELPLVEIPPLHAGEPLAVFVTGDGGWRAIDREIAQGLHERGYGIVGLVAPKFFATRRSPEEASRALQQIIVEYTRAWGATRVIAVGYSRGAGVLPFMINRLPASVRSSISVAALIGLDRTIDFYVTPFDLLRRAPTEAEIPVRGEVEKMRGIEVLCVYGTHDANNLCRDLPPSVVVHLPSEGGHHMKVSYDALARTIWQFAGKMPAEPPAGSRRSIERATEYSSAGPIARIQRGIGRIR